jgi:non-ribosomal peptide synthetase component F
MLAPVSIGDTVKVAVEVLEKQPTSNPNKGIQVWRYTVTNQRDETGHAARLPHDVPHARRDRANGRGLTAMLQATIADYYDRCVLHYADRTAISCGETSVSYAELGARADTLAGALQELGVAQGERIAFLMANCAEYFIASMHSRASARCACRWRCCSARPTTCT